jgi:hypothetical protein
MEIERIIYSITQYIKETKKQKISTEKIKVYIHNPVEMPDESIGQKVNCLV